ncbi:MAG: glycosyltransferase family 2 protein [Rhodobacterales bacterium]
MTDTPHTSQDRPLVTFALFAYNQENYIREAVEGAFSQTYEPLEIILSDDCSSDRTFEIMQEMAAAYAGPHKVRVRREAKNRNLPDHINNVAEVSNGTYIVMAAGDDFSLPDRTESLVAELARPGKSVFAAFSAHIPVNSTGALSGHRSQYRRDSVKSNSVSLLRFVAGAGGYGLGACYAYHRQVFSWPTKISSSLVREDRVLPIRAAILGDVVSIDYPAVVYRKEIVKKPRSSRMPLAIHDDRYWDNVRETLLISASQKFISRAMLFSAVSVLNYVKFCAGVKSLLGESSVRGRIFWRASQVPIRAVIRIRMKSN